MCLLPRYHPHIHQIAHTQLRGGATGVIVIEGLENIQPKVAGLPEYIMVCKDNRYQFLGLFLFLFCRFSVSLNVKTPLACALATAQNSLTRTSP